MEEYLTVRDIQRILKVSRPRAYQLIREGKLKSFKIGRLVRVRPVDLGRFVEGRSFRPAAMASPSSLLRGIR
jgi:excisionase family DNA binding protein